MTHSGPRRAERDGGDHVQKARSVARQGYGSRGSRQRHPLRAGLLPLDGPSRCPSLPSKARTTTRSIRSLTGAGNG
jgi:hypothetical protein